MDAAAEIDAVGGVIDLDQYNERVEAPVGSRIACATCSAADAISLDRRGERSDLNAILISCRSSAHDIADQYNAVFRFNPKMMRHDPTRRR